MTTRPDHPFPGPGTRIAAGAVLVAALLLFCLAWGMLRTQPGRDILAALVSGLATVSDTFKVRLEGLEGRLPGEIRLGRFQVADARGVWLEGEGLTLDWSPSDLLQGQWSFAEIRVRRVLLRRTPQAGDGLSLPSSIPVLPRVRADAVRIELFEAGEDVAGAPMRFSVAGTIAGSGERRETAMDIRSLDRTGDTLRVKAAAEADLSEGTLDAALEEGPGGLAGRLLGLPPKSSLSILLQGGGRAGEWKGRLTARADAFGEGEAEWRIGTAGPLVARAKGTARIMEHVLPSGLSPLLGPGVDFNLHLETADRERIEVREATLAARNVKLLATGEANLEKETFSSRLQLVFTEKGLGFPYAGVLLENPGPLEVTAWGRFRSPLFRLEATLGAAILGRIRAEGGGIHLQGRFADGGEAEVGGRATLGRLSLGDASAKAFPVTAEFRTSTPDWNDFDVEQLRLLLPGAELTAHGRARLDSSDVNGTAVLALSRLDALPLAVAGLSGSGKAEAGFSIQGRSGKGEARFHGSFFSPGGLPEPLPLLLEGETRFSGKTTFGDGVLRLEAFQARGEKAALSGNGSYRPKGEILDAEWRGALPSLSALSGWAGVPLAGGVNLRGTVSGTYPGITARTILSSAQSSVQGFAFETLKGEALFTSLPRRASGTLAVTTRLQGLPVELKTKVSPAGETVLFSGIELTGPGFRTTGKGVLHLRDMTVAGDVRGEAKDIGVFLPPSAGLAGSGALEMELLRREGRQDARLSLSLSDPAYGAVVAEEAHCEAQLVDILGKIEGNAELRIDNMRRAELKLDRFEATARGNGRSVSFTASGQGDMGRPLHMAAAGGLKMEEQHWDLTWESLQGAWGSMELGLAGPARLRGGAKGYRLESLEMSLGPGRLLAKGALEPGLVNADVSIERFPLFPVAAYLGLPFSGSGLGRAVLSGAPSMPRLDARAELRELRDQGGVRLPDMVLRASLERERFRTEAEAAGGEGTALRAEAEFPVRLSLVPPDAAIPASAPLTGGAHGALNATALSSLFFFKNMGVGGMVDLDLSLTGCLTSPEVHGRVGLTKGRFDDPLHGVALGDVEAEILAVRDRLELKRFIAVSAAGGDVSARGALRLDRDEAFPFQGTAHLNEFRYHHGDRLSATISGEVSLSGNLKKNKLAGGLTLDPCEVVLPDRLSTEVPEIEVEKVNAPGGETGLGPAPPPRAFDPSLDLTLDLPARFFVRGRGLDAEFKGRIRVSGMLSSPDMQGALSVVRGRYQFLDRNFTLKEGTLLFGGGGLAPLLNVTAETRVKTLTAKIRLHGPADSFQLELTSEPVLPAEEILARVLFNRSVSRLNPLQAVRLANAVRQLTGLDSGSSLDVLDKARQMLGVDQLGVQSGEDGQGGERVGVGKYLREDVYVEVGRNLETGGGEVSVEVEVTPNLSLESKGGADNRVGLGVQWEYDY